MYRPYTSIDIETSGLGPDVDVLQISAVYDDGDVIGALETFDVILKHYKLKSAEPYALWMNAGLIDTIRKNEDPRLEYPKLAMRLFIAKLKEWQQKTAKYDDDKGLPFRGKHMVAGKNVAGFDKPKLIQAAETYGNKDMRQELESTWVHRTLDPGSMYAPIFGYNPNLTEINKYNDRNEVTHNALDDAFDVVHAIRRVYGEQRTQRHNPRGL